MCLSDFAREHTSITRGRDGLASTITVRAGCDRSKNTFKLVLSKHDATALVALLEAFERREGVSVAGDKSEASQKAKVPRLAVAVRALAHGLLTHAPLSSLSSSLSTPNTVPTVPIEPRTV